jgi:hypothetical protein
MREETRQKLDRELRRRQMKWIGLGAAITSVMGLGFWFTGLDASVKVNHVAGVVENVGPLNMPGMTTKAIEEGYGVDVKLEDGRLAHVMVLKTTNPQVGQKVEIAEHVHGSGRTTFSWK